MATIGFSLKYLQNIQDPTKKTTCNRKSFAGVFPFVNDIKMWLDNQQRK